MTTTQTIDGVPRRLLVEAMWALDNAGIFSTATALRALLDAPEVLVVPLTGPKEWLDSLRPAAQPQGEPVAWQHRVTAGPQTGWSLWAPGRGKEYSEHYTVEVRPLYAEQPAPVAVDRTAHANPPPGTEPSGTHHDNDGLDEMRKPICCGSCPGGCVIQKESK